jgi:hypothetical protein
VRSGRRAVTAVSLGSKMDVSCFVCQCWRASLNDFGDLRPGTVDQATPTTLNGRLRKAGSMPN